MAAWRLHALEITGDYRRLLEITGDYRRLLEITGDYRRLLELTGDYRRLLVSILEITTSAPFTTGAQVRPFITDDPSTISLMSCNEDNRMYCYIYQLQFLTQLHNYTNHSALIPFMPNLAVQVLCQLNNGGLN